MTTLTPQQAAEQFRADLRTDLAEIMDELHSQRAELTNIRADLEAIRSGLTQAASQPAPKVTSQTKIFLAVSIAHGFDENGKEFFKMRGGDYSKNGVRIWPEVLDLLGIDKQALAMGVNPITPINVLVEMHDYLDPKTKETRVTPYKIIGKA